MSSRADVIRSKRIIDTIEKEERLRAERLQTEERLQAERLQSTNIEKVQFPTAQEISTVSFQKLCVYDFLMYVKTSLHDGNFVLEDNTVTINIPDRFIRGSLDVYKNELEKQSSYINIRLTSYTEDTYLLCFEIDLSSVKTCDSTPTITSKYVTGSNSTW